jgi:hypothetical protein
VLTLALFQVERLSPPRDAEVPKEAVSLAGATSGGR